MPRQQKTSQAYLDRLEQVKKYIMDFWETHHYSPSTNEIADYFETSTSVVKYWMNRFEKDGWIEPRASSTVRNIVPVEIFRDRPVFPEQANYLHDSGI